MSSPASRRQNYKDFTIRLARVAKKGTSSTRHNSLQELVAGNKVGSFSEFCTSVIAKAEALPEPEIKYLLPAKTFQTRLDGHITYWVQHYRRWPHAPKEKSKAENHLVALQSVRRELFGEDFDEASVPLE